MVSQKNTPVDQGRWAFVTTSPTTRRPTAAQRTLMRKHIMKDIGYSRRACQQSAASSSSSCSASEASPRSTEGTSATPEDAEIPKALLSAGTSSITMDKDAHFVLNQVFSDALPSHVRVYKEKWYDACISDPAAFHQMLACCATHLFRWKPDVFPKLQRVAINEHAKALTIARERLKTASLVTEEHLTVVLMFACYAHLENDLPTFSMHMRAIRSIVASGKCDIGEDFKRLYQSIDSIGSYAFGINPSPLLPTTTSPSALAHTTLGKPLLIFINALDINHRLLMLQAFQSLQDLNNYLMLVCMNPSASILDEPFKMDLLVEPVARGFLAVRLPINMPGHESALLTYIRAGALLYLAELRRRSGISPVMTTFQIDKLKQSMKILGHHPEIDPAIRLWILTAGALESQSLSDRSYFCSHIEQLRFTHEIETLEQYEDQLRRIVWFDPLFRARLIELFPST